MVKYLIGICCLGYALALTNCKIKGHQDTELTASDYVIAYNVLFEEQNSNYEVFTMNFDGSNPQNLTTLGGVEWTYNSYQDKLYFISDKDTCHRCFFLYETDYHGKAPRKISATQLEDSWISTRKNGKEFIVKPSLKIDSAFHIINTKGQLISRLETGLAFSADPLFVNEGQQVVFRGGFTKNRLIPGFNEALFIIDLDGENRRQLTHYPERDTTAGPFAYRAGTPKWHPTENFVSFHSKQNGKYSLYGVTLDGKQQWKLTNINTNEGWHEWRPDGKWLVIELFDDAQSQFHIGLMNWKTKEFKILTDSFYIYQQAPNFLIKTTQ